MSARYYHRDVQDEFRDTEEREESGTVAIKGNEKENVEERYCKRDLEREGAISRERREA